MNPEERFSRRVRDYLLYRPGYPEQTLEQLWQHSALPQHAVVADIGSGTGLYTELLLQRGCRVFGVEPNAGMRNAGLQVLGRYEQFSSTAGRAEDTGLPAASVDLVVAAQAFHWFDRPRARVEFQRILRPGGWVAILWNERRTETTAFLQAYEALLLRYGTDYAAVDHRNITEDELGTFFGGDFQHCTSDNFQRLDESGLLGRILSCSYVPGEGEPGHGELLEAVHKLYREHGHDDGVVIEYDTQLYLGQLAGA